MCRQKTVVSRAQQLETTWRWRCGSTRTRYSTPRRTRPLRHSSPPTAARGTPRPTTPQAHTVDGRLLVPCIIVKEPSALTPKRCLSRFLDFATTRRDARQLLGAHMVLRAASLDCMVYTSNMWSYSRASCWCIMIFVATSRVRVGSQIGTHARAKSKQPGERVIVTRPTATLKCGQGWVFVGCKRVSL